MAEKDEGTDAEDDTARAERGVTRAAREASPATKAARAANPHPSFLLLSEWADGMPDSLHRSRILLMLSRRSILLTMKKPLVVMTIGMEARELMLGGVGDTVTMHGGGEEGAITTTTMMLLRGSLEREAVAVVVDRLRLPASRARDGKDYYDKVVVMRTMVMETVVIG